MHKVRRGFTMVELIFVIVIIGILSSVAIPKLAASRDDAQAAVCVHQYTQLIKEITGAYVAAGGLEKWQSTTLESVTNLPTSVTAEGNGLATAGTSLLHDTTLKYHCDGEYVGRIYPTIANDTYMLIITPMSSSTSPVGLKFYEKIRKNLGIVNTSPKYLYI